MISNIWHSPQCHSFLSVFEIRLYKFFQFQSFFEIFIIIFGSCMWYIWIDFWSSLNVFMFFQFCAVYSFPFFFHSWFYPALLLIQNSSSLTECRIVSAWKSHRFNRKGAWLTEDTLWKSIISWKVKHL